MSRNNTHHNNVACCGSSGADTSSYEQESDNSDSCIELENFKFKDLIENLKEVCKQSDNRLKLSACLVKGNTIFYESLGYNHNNPISDKKGIVVSQHHAEVDSIMRYYKSKKLKSGSDIYVRNKYEMNFYDDDVIPRGTSLIVIRSNKKGDLNDARPCINCLNTMKQVGIHKVYYSVTGGYIVSESVKTMASIHVCSSVRYISDSKKINLSNIGDYEKIFDSIPSVMKKENLFLFIEHNIKTLFKDNYNLEFYSCQGKGDNYSKDYVAIIIKKYKLVINII